MGVVVLVAVYKECTRSAFGEVSPITKRLFSPDDFIVVRV